MVYGLKSLLIAVSVAGLVTGCPLAPEESATSPTTTTTPVGQTAINQNSGTTSVPAVSTTVTTTPGPVAVPLAPGEIVISDSLEIVIARLFSRKVLVGGVEMNWDEAMALAKATKEAGGDVQLVIGSGRRHGIFRLLATDNDEKVQVHGNGHGWGWLSQLFAFEGSTFSVKNVLVSIAKVEARKEDGTWITLAEYGAEAPRVDLMALHQGGYLEFGAFYMEPGTYTRAKVTLVGENKVVVDEGDGPEEKNLTIFPASKKVLELIAPFTVTTQGLTSIKIDFNVKKSIFRFFGSYVMKPFFKVLGVDAGTVVDQPVSADDGGVIALDGDVSLTIPPGALAEDTFVKVRPEYFLRPHKTPGLMTVGHEFVIEPTALQLLTPATLAINVSPNYAPAVGLTENSLSVRHYDEATDQWVEDGGEVVEGGVAAPINSFGRFVAAGAQEGVTDAACGWLTDSVQLGNQHQGLDLSFFAEACRRQSDCYAHGFKTYGKSGGACDDDFAADLAARCQDLPTADPVAGPLALVLFDACNQLVPRVHGEAVARHDERYPGEAASTCNDYDGLGISCAPASCSVTASPASIPANLPTDISFSVVANGNIESIDFDGSQVYVGAAVPYLTSTQMIDVLDTGRILSDDRTYLATVHGPGGDAQCSVTVRAIQAPKPCVMTITPSVIAPGGSATLFTAIQPGYNSAFADIRTENVLTQVGLTAPDANGMRYFTTVVRPTASRGFHARVVHTNGSESFCQASVTVQ